MSKGRLNADSKDSTKINASFEPKEVLCNVFDQHNTRENNDVSDLVLTCHHITLVTMLAGDDTRLQTSCNTVTRERLYCSSNQETTVSQNNHSNAVSLPYSTGLIGILILISTIAMSLIVTLWPQHNSILQPEYWYDPIIRNLDIWAYNGCRRIRRF